MINSLLKILLITSSVYFSTACDKVKFGSGEKIKPVKTYKLKISEPSGLALKDDKLWIVSDRKSSVHRTDLEGNEEFSFKIKDADLEGISIVDDSLLAIVKEISREIVITDFEGNEKSNTKLNVDGSKNSGLEGITYNPSNKHFYVLNEKDPVLIIETDKKFKELNRKKIKELRDLSGISYSSKENCLWLVSDEEKRIIKCSLDWEFIEEYKIDIDQAEGIAIDDKKNLLYVVSDKEEKLFVFDLNNLKQD